MEKFEIFDVFAAHLAAERKNHLITGIALMILGILTLVFPALLAMFASLFFILVGVLFLSAAWRGWQFHKNYHTRFREDLFDLWS